jgi:hypothetical protein
LHNVLHFREPGSRKFFLEVVAEWRNAGDRWVYEHETSMVQLVSVKLKTTAKILRALVVAIFGVDS